MVIAQNSGLAIAPLRPADAEALADFFHTLAGDPETGRFFHPHPLSADAARELAAGSWRDRYYLARYRGHVAAYSMLRGWDAGFEVPSFGGCTHPALRDAGLGHAVLAHAIAAARATGARRLRLTVYRDNERAVHVYRKFGFVFTPRNARESVGVLDLAAAPEPPTRPLNVAVLDRWARAEDGPPSPWARLRARAAT
jgi:ribosomal protein S18 acetylase RimI-like enzyme